MVTVESVSGFLSNLTHLVHDPSLLSSGKRCTMEKLLYLTSANKSHTANLI